MSTRPPHVDSVVFKYYKYLNPHPRELIAAKKPPRIFMREGEVSQWRPKERRMKRKFLILFDDTLVVCRRNNRTSFVTKIIFRLTAGTLKCALVSNSSYYIKGVEFRIWNRTRTFVFFGKSPSNALSWVRDIVYAMNGGRIPYRPVVDPKTGEEIDGEGEKKDKDLLKLMEKRKEEDRVSGGSRGNNADFLANVDNKRDFDMPAPREEDGGDLIPNFDPFGSSSSSSSSSAGPSNASVQNPPHEELVPYNPFLSVGANPFNPFEGQQQPSADPFQQQQMAQEQQMQSQQAQLQPDWTMMLEKAAMDLCLFGKSTIMDLEQMRELDKSLVDSEVHSQAKQTKGNYEVLYQGTTRLANERDPSRRQAEAQALSQVAAMNLPAMRQFVFNALQKVENVKDDFAKGRQRYMLQVLDKAIMTLYTLLPNELKGQQQPAAAPAEQQQPQQQQQEQQQPPAKEEKDPFGDWDPFGSSNVDEKVSPVEAELTEIVEAVKQSASDLSAIQEQAPCATIENTLNLTNLLAELLRVATEAEKSLGETARKSGQAYHRDPTWEDGLISAAKSVLQNVGLLVNSAKSVTAAVPEEVEAECDTLLACVRSMNGATARLVMASRVKIPPMSEHSANIDAAAGNVKRAAGELESSTLEQALSAKKSSEPEPAPAPTSSVKNEAAKLNAMTKVAKLERELEMARQQLSNMNTSEYKS